MDDWHAVGLEFYCADRADEAIQVFQSLVTSFPMWTSTASQSRLRSMRMAERDKLEALQTGSRPSKEDELFRRHQLDALRERVAQEAGH